MNWSRTKKQTQSNSVERVSRDFDESLLLIVDPEQLSSNLLSRLQGVVDVQDAVVYVPTGTEGMHEMQAAEAIQA